MARPKSHEGTIICKWCKTEMVAKGWSASEGHIWVCPHCKAKKFEFNHTKGEVIYRNQAKKEEKEGER